MKTRVLFGIIVSSFVAGTVLWAANDADAQRRQRRQNRRVQRTPHSDAIAPALGEIQWGWSRRELLEHFTKKIRNDFQPRIHKARDAMTEDQLRHQRDQQIRRIRSSYVEFNGQTTGHDSGFLRDEFTHRNRESMLRVRSENADNYYFFIRGRLWKWYRAFDASVFQGADFDQFAASLQGRFGQGRVRSGALIEGAQERQWIEWQDDSTRARAVDNNTFYGFYCLIFEEKDTLHRLEELRTNGGRNRDQGHALVDSVISDGEETDSDTNADIADRITGNIRRREDAPANDDSSMKP